MPGRGGVLLDSLLGWRVREVGSGRGCSQLWPWRGWALGGLAGQPPNCRDVSETGLGLGRNLGLMIGAG